jgi:quercetin dioxygenase-like cupin family protein
LPRPDKNPPVVANHLFLSVVQSSKKRGEALFFDKNNLPQRELAEGVVAGLAWGDNVMLSFVNISPRADVPSHSHPHEQMGLVLTGEVEITIAGETKLLSEGDVFLVPSGVAHSARSLKDRARVLDIFSPPREDLE